jgi:hypothetical protein
MPLRKGLAFAALLIPWMVWKHRNACIFEGTQPYMPLLLQNIKEVYGLGQVPRAYGTFCHPVGMCTDVFAS